MEKVLLELSANWEANILTMVFFLCGFSFFGLFFNPPATSNKVINFFSKLIKPVSLVYLSVIIITLITLLVSGYVKTFRTHPISGDPAHWGQMGDFFGGMLNPILAFASFIALLYTIRIQSSELDLTRRELEKSAKAQKDSSETLQHQLNESRKQYLMAQYHELFVSISSNIDECISNRNIGSADQFRSYKAFLLYAFEFSLHGSFKRFAPKLECRTTPYIYQSELSYTGKLVERDTCQMLGRLAHLMQEYAMQFGATAVYRDCIFRFTETVSFMHYAEVLDARFEDFQIFNIDEFYESAGFCALDMPKNSSFSPSS